MFFRLFSIVFLFFVVFLNWISFAQSWSEYKVVDLDLMNNDSVNKSISDINSVKVYFCNWEQLSESLFINAIPGEEKEICLRFENLNSNTINFSSSFFETSITASWYPVCSSADPNNLFTKSIVNKRNNITKVPAWSFVQKAIKLKFPIWYSGLYHFCHYYNIAWGKASVPMFNIVVNKQNFMDVFINTENVRLSWNVDVLDFERDNEKISFSIKNSFPFDQEVNFDLKISNIFWFEKEFVLSGDKIGYNASKNFDININDLPYYKWPFDIKFVIKHKPSFDFDVSNSWIDKAILDGWEMVWETSFFIFDKVQLIMLAVFFLFCFLIWAAFLKKHEIVYVQKDNSIIDKK